MAEKKNAALGFIFVTLLIDCLGIGLIIPVLPALLKEMTGGNLSQASMYGGVLMATYAVMQFVCSPIAGNLSDKYGRRPILLLSLLGLGVDYLFLAFAPNIWLFFVGRVIAGIFGASFTTASAYIADISTPEKRSQNFGMIGAAFGIGFMLGPAIGGLFAKFGLRVPFMIAAGFSLVNFLYGYFILPESLSKENRRAFEWKRANPVGALMHMKRYPSIISLLIATALLAVAGHAAQSTWTYINMEKFKWTTSMVGTSLSVVGLLVGLVQGGLIRVIIPKIGQKNTVFAGLIMYVIGFVLFAVATKGWMMFVFLVPYCLGGVAMPAIQGIVSTKIPANEQGELQGVMTSLMSLASIAGPLLMTWLFHYFTSPNTSIYFPGAPFIMGGVLTVISIGIAANSLSSWHPPAVAEEIDPQ